MTAAVRTPVVVWGVLAVVTVVSFWLGTDHGFDDPRAGGVALVVLAFVKVDLVGMHFMELRHAAPVLRAAFHAYVAVVAGVLCTLLIVL